MKLRDYQLECLAASEAAWQAGIRNQLAVLATGAGKTVIACELMRRRPGRSIVLVDRDVLGKQWVEKAEAAMPGRHVGKVKAEANKVYADVVIASIDTLLEPGRLERLPRFKPDTPAAFNTVIPDEAQGSIAEGRMRALDYLGVNDPRGPLLFGVTATPDRLDGRGLNELYSKIVYEKNLLELINEGWLVMPRAQRVYLNINLDAAQTGPSGDFTDESLVEIMKAGNAPELIAKALRLHAPNRKSLLFLPSVQLAYLTAKACRSVGFAAEALDGARNSTERTSVLDRFASGEIQVVSNCDLLGVGFDEPTIDCIGAFRPTMSRSLLSADRPRNAAKPAGRQDGSACPGRRRGN